MLKVIDTAPMARSLISKKQPVIGVANLNQVEDLGTLNLRLGNEADLAIATRVLGAKIPRDANTFDQQGEVTVLWLGPDEWMVQAPLHRIPKLKDMLEAGLSGRHFAANDVSDHSVAMELSGGAARRVLEKGCPIDLHPRAFGPGRCAQSHFLQALILVAQLDHDRYLLRVRRSMSEYLWDALADAIEKVTPQP